MAGVYSGFGNPQGQGPFQFTVTNDVSNNWQKITLNWQILSGNSIPAGGFVAGYTDLQIPFTNYTGRNLSASQVADTQIWELGNSLAGITGQQIPQNWNIQPGPQNNEPGHQLLGCYTYSVVSAATQPLQFLVRRSRIDE
jgi:hypothetical protein